MNLGLGEELGKISFDSRSLSVYLWDLHWITSGPADQRVPAYKYDHVATGWWLHNFSLEKRDLDWDFFFQNRSVIYLKWSLGQKYKQTWKEEPETHVSAGRFPYHQPTKPSYKFGLNLPRVVFISAAAELQPKDWSTENSL